MNDISPKSHKKWLIGGLHSDVKIWTIDQVSDRLQNRQTSSLALTNECLDKISKQNPRLNLLITMTTERARKTATESDKRVRASKRLSRLDGVPVAVKDYFFI